jgi:hypothetical protein
MVRTLINVKQRDRKDYGKYRYECIYKISPLLWFHFDVKYEEPRNGKGEKKRRNAKYDTSKE